jgi:transcription elongation factor GreB
VRGIIGTEARAFRGWVTHKCTKSHDRLANANKAAAPRTGARGSGADTQNYISPAGLQRLKDEHLFLLSRERPAVEVVAWAASNGDRSENADFLYGKRRLGQIDSRIRFLTKRIDAAVVVDPAATRVFFGATVTYKDTAGLEHVVSIVGIDEVDLDRGYISWRSPLANALMKASPGDRVDLRAPAKT